MEKNENAQYLCEELGIYFGDDAPGGL